MQIKQKKNIQRIFFSIFDVVRLILTIIVLNANYHSVFEIQKIIVTIKNIVDFKLYMHTVT